MKTPAKLPKRKRVATVKDVAAELGISVATVSRAISKPAMLRPDTVARVLDAIERLGYRPNLAARDLRLRATGLAVVIVPSLSPFFLDVFRGIETAARENGYSAMMGHTDRSPEREAELFDRVAQGRADGVLLVSTSSAVDILRRQRHLPPTVILLDAVQGHHFPTVRVDHTKGAIEATNHLIALGHKRIGHIRGPDGSPMAQHRYEGYCQALAKAGLTPDDALCARGAFTVKSGETAMEKILTQPWRPTAIFAANDEMAIGAIRCCKSAGLHVPSDMSIIGFDDQRIAGIYDPPLTTIQIPTAELGYQAMIRLIHLLNHKRSAREQVLGTKLILRATTAPPHKQFSQA